MNKTSSRSHCVFSLSVSSKSVTPEGDGVVEWEEGIFSDDKVRTGVAIQMIFAPDTDASGVAQYSSTVKVTAVCGGANMGIAADGPEVTHISRALSVRHGAPEVRALRPAASHHHHPRRPTATMPQASPPREQVGSSPTTTRS